MQRGSYRGWILYVHRMVSCYDSVVALTAEGALGVDGGLRRNPPSTPAHAVVLSAHYVCIKGVGSGTQAQTRPRPGGCWWDGVVTRDTSIPRARAR